MIAIPKIRLIKWNKLELKKINLYINMYNMYRIFIRLLNKSEIEISELIPIKKSDWKIIK